MNKYIILSLVINIFCTSIFTIPIYLLLTRKNKGIHRKIATIIFMVYIVAIFTLVGIPSIDRIEPELRLNIIPFIDIVQSPVTSLLNVLLFIPLGIFLPVLWKDKYNSIVKILLCGFLLSLSIEIMQIFTFRLTDINDLITNTVGTMIGYFLYSMLLKKIKIINRCKQDVTENKINYPTVTLSVFLIMLFISNFLSGIVWNLII